MDIMPLNEYKTPKYPDKVTVLKSPQILKTVPERWRGNAYVCAALGALMMASLTSCARKQQNETGSVETSTKTGSSSKKKKALIAPIFEHGQGRGSFGCSSVAPPSFLSEEEAFQVIQEEAKQYGINFEKNAFEIKKAGIPKTSFYLKPENGNSGYNENGSVIKDTKSGTLQLDGYDVQNKIAFEFISEEDYSAWAIEEGKRSTVDDYDFLSTAKVLSKGLNGKNGENTIGIFYNPMVGFSEDEMNKIRQESFEEMKVRRTQLAKDDLKKQVRDFLEWLKAQGIM